MDESSAYLASQGYASDAQGSASGKAQRRRAGSIASHHSAQSASQPSPRKPKTPLLRSRKSSNSVQTNGSESEIISPVPRRHHVLQNAESRHWLGTPPLSPPGSRPISPMSNTTTSPRAHRFSSFSSMVDQEHRLFSTRAAHAERKAESENSMAKRWVRWMHKQNMREWVVPTAILASIWIKWAIGLGSYSGKGNPPMYGDYEAQRHWMELTIHLPVRQWYTYDLQYWGLDYPPLTAYVSWLCGTVGSWITPAWFALDKSRGIETPESQVYMRSTVLFFDSIIYLPALLLFIRVWHRSRSSRTQHYALLVVLLQPALLLIDFGHFQYNSVMLGFTLLALSLFASGQDLLGAVCFVLSLGFKQMALYYAPAIGSYLISKCIYLGPRDGPALFTHLAMVTAAAFTILFLPFLPPFAPFSAILDPITRVFPFNRGLFEDKVANFWCASNVVIKWKQWVSRAVLAQLSALLTAVGFAPAPIGLIRSGLNFQKSVDSKESSSARESSVPFISLLPYALLTSSMSFFLFSFQVHEKSILVPLLPITIMMSASTPDSSTFEIGALVNNIAVFSMWPLLKRDGLSLQYFAVTILWNRLIGYNPFKLQPTTFVQQFSLVACSACVALHILEILIPAPARYPDLYPVLNVLISTPVFVLTWLWSMKRGLEARWALGSLGGTSRHGHSKSASQDMASGVPVSKGMDGRIADGAAGSIGRAAGQRTVSLGVGQVQHRVLRSPGGSLR